MNGNAKRLFHCEPRRNELRCASRKKSDVALTACGRISTCCTPRDTGAGPQPRNFFRHRISVVSLREVGIIAAWRLMICRTSRITKRCKRTTNKAAALRSFFKSPDHPWNCRSNRRMVVRITKPGRLPALGRPVLLGSREITYSFAIGKSIGRALLGQTADDRKGSQCYLEDGTEETKISVDRCRNHLSRLSGARQRIDRARLPRAADVWNSVATPDAIMTPPTMFLKALHDVATVPFHLSSAYGSTLFGRRNTMARLWSKCRSLAGTGRRSWR